LNINTTTINPNLYNTNKKGAFIKSTFFIFYIIFLVTFSSCRITKKTTSASSPNNQSRDKKTETMLHTANEYLSTPYKYGGVDKNGMDCSGLIWTSFKRVDITLPRTTKEQSNFGKAVELGKAEEGDLVFFATNSKNRSEINHVGIITRKKNNILYFIHSSIKLGVVENNLSEKYYNDCFIKIMRVY